MDVFTSQIIGVFLAETLKNVAKGSANTLYNNFNSLFQSEIIALGLDSSINAEEIATQLETKPEILETVRQKLNAHPTLTKEMSKITNQTINNYGLSYSETKEVALDVFKVNFISLSEQASTTAKKRAEELVDKFLNEIKEQNSDLLNSVQQPGMQNALYTAQKGYAISGDKDTAEMLVDILVERAGQTERNLRQIVLDESLEVIPKLTNEQLDVLTVTFLIKYTTNYRLLNLPELKKYFDVILKPFVDNLPKKVSSYQHLEYCKCGSAGNFGISLESIFWKNYLGLFSKGMDQELYVQTVYKSPELIKMIIPCLHDNSRFQVSAQNVDGLSESVALKGLSQENENELLNIFHLISMSEAEVKDFLSNHYEVAKNLFNIWEETPLKSFTLTTVGIAIAQAHYKKTIGEEIDLSIWIE